MSNYFFVSPEISEKTLILNIERAITSLRQSKMNSREAPPKPYHHWRKSRSLQKLDYRNYSDILFNRATFMCGKALQSLSRPFAQLVYQNFSAPAARRSCREPRRVGHVFLSEPYEALPLAIALTVIFGRDGLDSRAETAEPRNGTDMKTYLLSPYDLIVQGC